MSIKQLVYERKCDYCGATLRDKEIHRLSPELAGWVIVTVVGSKDEPGWDICLNCVDESGLAAVLTELRSRYGASA